ncbi:hypothetical protein Pfo_021155 [Paulownia fortunei]|nr:hypothetical protein Pfo_021155 [Paulownia fortunei]
MEVVSTNNYKHGEDDEAAVVALAACASHVFPMALSAAIQLDLFEIIAKAGDGAHLSPSDIASQLPTTNDGAAVVLDLMLRLLASHALLTCSISKLANGATERRYGLAPAGKFFVGDESGVSFAQFQAFLSKGGTMEFSLKDAVLEGGKLFERIYGKSYYQFMVSDPESGKMFNDVMGAHSTVLMKKVVKIYDGFEGLSSIVNVGGGTGATLDILVSKYPSIQGINFDLPQVVQTAPSYLGNGGDMFLEVPKGDDILLKFILHNWGDDQCTILLKNCYKALPNKGKLIVMDYILPNTPQTDVHSKYASQMDIIMSTVLGGKERTEDEFEAMANKAGFAEFKIVCYVYGMWIMEFIKLV